MQRKIINQLPDFSVSPSYEPIRATLNNLIDRVTKLQKDKLKDEYLNTFKQMSWSMGKCTPNWPDQIQSIALKLKTQLNLFEGIVLQKTKQKKGFLPICGGSNKGPTGSLQPIYMKILGYKQIFGVISGYQDKKLKENTVYSIMSILDQNNALQDTEKSRMSMKSLKSSSVKVNNNEKNQMCDYCELMKSVSICPNGYTAKKLLRELTDTEWIAGIMYEDGKVVDKNLEKAIEFYEKGKQKKNPDAIYRLGLLNEKGQYGRPFQYLKMWEQSARMGHLQSMTDLGYLYQNGLEDQNRLILQPNSDKAYAYYKKAVEQNFPRALNNLASFYYNNEKYKNIEKCLKYFQLASEAEYVKSLYNLGIINLQGEIVPADVEKALNLIKRSAEKGDVQGKQQYIQMMLGNVHKCSSDDLFEINMYCRQIIAEEEDNPYAYYFMGIMYEGGYGVPQEPQTAILYYTKSARFQCPQAYMKLGDCYKNAFGVQLSGKDAIYHFQKAAKQLPQALVCIGQIYQKGFPDLKQNFEQAFNHYYTACNYEIPQAYQHLGSMYRHGRHVKRDESKANEYFALANNHKRNKKCFGKLSNSTNMNLIESSYFRNKK